MHQLGFFERFPERFDAIAAKRRVLRQRGDGHAGFVERNGIGNGVLRAVSAGTKDVLVPLFAGDRISYCGLDQQNLFVLFGHRQHGQRNRRSGWADRDVNFVVAIGCGQQALAQIRLALVVFFNHHQFFARHHHRATGGVVQAHHEADSGLLAVGFERAGLAVDVGDFYLTGLADGQWRDKGCGKRGERDQGATVHGCLLLGLCTVIAHCVPVSSR